MHYPILAYVAIFSTVPPILIGVFRWQFISREMKILVAYLLFGLMVDVLSMWFITDYWISLSIMHLFFLIECIFIISIIICLQESPKNKKFFIILLSVYVLFWFVAKLTFEPIDGLYSITATISSILMALSAGYTLFIVIGNRMQSLFSVRSFWFLLSFIILYAGTLILLSLQEILVNYSREDLFLVQSINWSLKIVFNILVTIGFLCPQTQQ